MLPSVAVYHNMLEEAVMQIRPYCERNAEEAARGFHNKKKERKKPASRKRFKKWNPQPSATPAS